MDTPGEGGTGKVPALRRFTTEYDGVEDRIRLTLERAEGDVLRLWLTRRLLVRAVPELVKILDTRLQTEEGQPVGFDALSQRRDQRAALGGLSPQQPVRPAEGQPVADHLITAVGLRLTRKAVLLDMKAADRVVQTVPLAIPHIRQWLALLHHCFGRAGWEDDIWPDWLTPLKAGEAPPGLRLN